MIRSVARTIFDYVRVCFWLLVAIFSGAFAAPVLGDLEGRLVPVGRNFRITQVETSDGSVKLAGTMLKTRDCAFLDLTAYIGKKGSPVAKRERLEIVFHDQPENVATSRLRGFQAWGYWEVVRPDDVEGPDVWLEVRHRCHALWETVTPLLTIQAHRLFGAERDIMDLYAVED